MRFLIFSVLFSWSIISSADITYGDFVWDESSNYVENTVTGTRYLRWSETAAMNFEEASLAFGESGWTVADYNDLGTIYDNFFPLTEPNSSATTWTYLSNPNSQLIRLPTGDRTNEEVFQSMFGFTFESIGLSGAYFDGFGENIGLAQVQVIDPNDTVRIFWDGNYDPNSTRYGIAMVQPVPLPTAMWMFLAGMVSILTIRKTLHRSNDQL